MRVKQKLFLRPVFFASQPGPSLFQRLGVRSNNPCASWHDAGTIVDKQIAEERISRPVTSCRRKKRITPADRTVDPIRFTKRQLAKRRELLLPFPLRQHVEPRTCWFLVTLAKLARRQNYADWLLHALKNTCR